MSQNNRRFDRAPVSVEVHYRTRGSFLVSYSLNLSKGGLFLETNEPPPVGSTLAVRFTIPGSDMVETQARVMWVRKRSTEEGFPPGMGLQFDALEQHIGKMIDKMAQSFAGVVLMALADDPAALDRLTRYLQSILTCTVLCSSSDKVMATGFSKRLDLILLDLDSAGEQGLNLLPLAKETDPPLLLIALTRDPVLKAMALKENAAAVLDNPPAYEALRQIVLEVLGRPSHLGS